MLLSFLFLGLMVNGIIVLTLQPVEAIVHSDYINGKISSSLTPIDSSAGEKNAYFKDRFSVKLKPGIQKKSLPWAFKNKNLGLALDHPHDEKLEQLNKRFGVKDIKFYFQRFADDDPVKAKDKFFKRMEMAQQKKLKMKGKKLPQQPLSELPDITLWMTFDLEDMANIDPNAIYISSESIEEKIKSICAEYLSQLPEVIEQCAPIPEMELYGLPNDTFIDSNPRDGVWDTGALAGNLHGEYFNMWGLEKIQALDAWEKTRGRMNDGTPVVVAVVDTGLDYNHLDIAKNLWSNHGEDLNANGIFDREDLNANGVLDAGEDLNANGILDEEDLDKDGIFDTEDIIRDGIRDGILDSKDINGVDDDGNGLIDDLHGWDFADNDNDPKDVIGHGTHVAGTIAAVANNGIGIAGVAPEVLIMPVKGFRDKDGGSGENDLPNGIIYAAEMGADVINNSWGCKRSCPRDPPTEDAVRIAHNLGAVVVFAAGNNNENVRYYTPQNMAETVTVASSDYLDKRSDFSNYGNLIDVAAPGGDSGFRRIEIKPCVDISKSNILSLRAQGTDLFAGVGCIKPTGENAIIPRGDLNGQYYTALGTSMAAPHVSGVAALVHAAKPQYSNEDIKNAIRYSADNIEDPGFDIKSGFGRVNALSAINREPGVVLMITETGNGEDTHSDGADGDGYLEPGEGGYFYIILKNLWLPANDINVQVTTTNPWIHLKETSATIKAIAPAKDEGIYFYFSIDPNVDTDKPIEFNVTITEASGFHLSLPVSAGYIVPLIINPLPLQAGQWPWPGKADLHIMGGYFPDPPIIADLDKDGQKEVVVFTSDGMTVLRSDGTTNPNWNWPQSIDAGYFLHRQAAGDIDGDGDLEIIAVNNYKLEGNDSKSNYKYMSKIYAWHHDGTPVQGWPKVMEDTETGIPVLANVDQDPNGTMEIILAYYHYQYLAPFVLATTLNVDVFDHDGNRLPNSHWPVSIDMNRYVISDIPLITPAVGDLDGDGDIEIILATPSETEGDNVYAWHHDGTPVKGWPVQARVAGIETYASTLAAGDLDYDGLAEVVVGLRELSINKEDMFIFVFRSNGVLMTEGTHWPLRLKGSGFFTIDGQGFALGDLDGDHNLEILFSDLGWTEIDGQSKLRAQVQAFHHNGDPVQGWPQTLLSRFRYFNITPVITDIDGKAGMEVLINMGWGKNFVERGYEDASLYAWHANGEPVEGFPKESRDDVFSQIALGDIDNDGDIEAAFISFDVVGRVGRYGQFASYVVDFPGDAHKVEWGAMGYNSQRTNFYQPANPIVLTKFVRGDVNGDGKLDISDAIATLGFLYLGNFHPTCMDAVDTDDNGTLEITDAIRTLKFLFSEGPPPEAPYPELHVDQTPDNLSCEKYP